jgi:iduronate 2-sulfatase
MLKSNLPRRLIVFGSLASALVGWVLIVLSSATVKPLEADRPNVLFIAVDDLRPDLGCYGNKSVKSPNLDQLALNSTVFTQQYVTQPTCGASRFSLLTGKRPRVPVEVTNDAVAAQISTKPRTDTSDTFIDNLRRNGYYTVGIGKVSHAPDGYVYGQKDPKSEQLELPNSWDEMLFNAGKWGNGWNAFFGYADGGNRQGKNSEVKPYESGDVGDNGYPDGLTAELAISKLQELKHKKQSFFLGIGFFKPHLPFNAPKKYWDLYDESKIPLTPSPELPENTDRSGLHGSNEFNQYKLGDEKASLDQPVSDGYARKLRHAYYAGISYVDAQIGRVLNELRKQGLDKNTIVVVWSDHGWHLGDHRIWGKHTLFDVAVRSVLIINSPNGFQGRRSEVVSSVDIYPTLSELCRVKTPTGLDGRSLVPLLKKGKVAQWDNVAYSYYNRGISVRTERYRLTKYFKEKSVIHLYDHQVDPFENSNIADTRPEVVKELWALWEKGNTGVYK